MISHGSGQPLATTPVAQVVQSKQGRSVEANACWWKRATHRLSASRSFRRCPFQRADHRNTLAETRHDSIAHHRYVPAETADLCRNTESHFSPPPLRRITVSSFGREKGKRGARGRREGWIRGTDEENGRSEIVDEDARNDPRA